jgi:hypothetical protein
MRRHHCLFALITAAAATCTPAMAGPLSPEQMAAAQQVYVGDAECEFKQAVHLKAVDGQPGHFELRFRKARYLLTPEPTSTGAIRLEDRKAGVVWLQIPAKSMLLNSRLGRREVDACMHAEQRADTGADTPSIGIAPR